MQAFGGTDIGKIRKTNQDFIYTNCKKIGPLPNLFVVADGMGGHNGGEIASSTAVEAFVSHCESLPFNPENPDCEPLDALVGAANYANRAVFETAEASPDLHGMGTTFTACSVLNDCVKAVHIGDSRLYLIGAEQITQVTQDHSYVGELVRAGQLTEAEAETHPKKNILTRVMGVYGDMQADGCTHPLEGYDSILLCSDGLTNMLSNDEIKEIVNEGEPVEVRVEKLIKNANANGGRDNITAVLIDMRGGSK